METDDDANFGVALSQPCEYVFICERPFLNGRASTKRPASTTKNADLSFTGSPILMRLAGSTKTLTSSPRSDFRASPVEPNLILLEKFP